MVICSDTVCSLVFVPSTVLQYAAQFFHKIFRNDLRLHKSA